MKISNLKITTVVDLLFYSGKILIAFFILSSILICSAFRKDIDGSVFFIAPVSAIILGYLGNIALRNYIISRYKYPLVLNIICNVLRISRKKISTQPIDIDLEQFIRDNNLSLTYYYINKPTYPILVFNKNKIRYFTQEYDWGNFKWDFYIKKEGRTSIEILEFRGINQDHDSIKERIEFEKIEAKNHEIVILFIIHDLLFGKGLSRYY